MVDQTRRKLHIPNWFSPYLERHRIYELFHELARELVIQQPADHVVFLKEILYNAVISRYAPRIVLISPPQIDVYEVAEQIARQIKVAIITDSKIINSIIRKKPDRPRPRKLTNALRDLLRMDNTYFNGWILPDYPRSRTEALYMQQEGILPTHVLQLVPPFAPDLYQLKYTKETDADSWLKYRRTILGIRDAFKKNLKEVSTGEKNLDEVVDFCIELIKIKDRVKSPVIPRICLLGPRGSGRKTQAKKISQSFNITYVDFEYLLCQTWISETYLGSLLRACKDKVGENSLLLTSVVHKRILQKDCIDRGWILTGFPNTLQDFKYFDMIDTPPNRVIFLECDMTECRERILNRKMNCYSGSVINILEKTAERNNPDYKSHPKDIENLFVSEWKYYCENYDSLRKYCGCTANIVDGGQIKQWVTENIQAIIMRPLPDCEPRAPCDSLYSEVSDDDDDDDQDASDQSLICRCHPCVKPGLTPRQLPSEVDVQIID